MPSIPEYFSGRTLFLTGGTGFIGKVLIEKLLRSCPALDKIYVLIRPKRNQNPTERLQRLMDAPFFDRLKAENPGAVEKVVAVEGNATEMNLGLSAEDREVLVKRVSFVVHAAATVRFDEPLGKAILMNTRGAREICQLALEMQQLELLVHVSTAYCNLGEKVVEEKLYPAAIDWKSAIKIAENFDPKALETLLHLFIGHFPNTYTFTKSLAEHVVFDLCQGRISTVIFRPSIVISTWEEPIPGWTDNFNGPVGLFAMSGKGIAQTIYGDPQIMCDFCPADLAIKILIGAMWDKGCQNDGQVTFFHCSFHNLRLVSLEKVIGIGAAIFEDVAFENAFFSDFKPRIHNNRHTFYFRFILLHLLPGFLADTLLKLFGKPPIVLKFQRKAYIANMALRYFMFNQWTFLDGNMSALRKKLKGDDQINFDFGIDRLDDFDFCTNVIIGIKLHLFQETMENNQNARRAVKRTKILFNTLKLSLYLLLAWVVLISYL